MDPPADGCRLCGSTWGDRWVDVQGRSEFFCCDLCAVQWIALVEEVSRRNGWPRAEILELTGNRWGRTGLARHGTETFRFAVVFTPEGGLRRFEALQGS